MIRNPFTTLGSAVLCTLVFCQCQTAPQATSIELSNTSSVNLTDKAIAIERTQLPNITEGEVYPLIIASTGDTIASQLNDLDGDQKWDEVFFVADLMAGGDETYSLTWVNEKPEYTVRTSARFGKRSSADTPVQPATSEVLLANQLPKSIGYQAYQTDGPSWENDKIGFRHYFDGRNAQDLFGKRASFISPENVGINANGEVEDNYHVMADWGRDILAVGNSVGLGGYSLMIGDSLVRLGVLVTDSINNVEKTTFNIVDEGPVKSIMDYHYENWHPLDRSYNVDERTVIWPGIYAYQNTVKFSKLHGDETLVVGLVNINNQNPLEEIAVNDDWMVLLTHDMQTYNRGWWLGLAIIVPRSIYEGYTEAPQTGKLTNSFLAKLKVENDKPVTYYAAAGWELSDDRFKNHDYWKSYVENLVQQLSAKVDVSIQ
ncbi:DUF4861 domain-containing protein [Mangrovibacterium diazotrophicum]|uniref:Uncharacterized protein DUF4861 n=1 Tax=Mangrovibacterium diazotrophicum TaxID=1261403 RepID=A0A419WAR7_9BACT|nr:DUF4861 domain-containing protein [Mangrovibacterium diazotrophicum]RKD92547.1 uncharacterized protein DUF4861 [Mangrovibacterium diazotrophicum]